MLQPISQNGIAPPWNASPSRRKKRAPRSLAAPFLVRCRKGLGRLFRFLAFERILRLGDDGAERLGLVHRDVREHLAVEGDAGEVQRVDELAVGQTFRADRGVDSLDPQSPEAPLLHLAVAIGVLAGLLDGLPGDADRVLATAVIALRLFQDPLVLCAGGNTPFDACHVALAPYFRP